MMPRWLTLTFALLILSGCGSATENQSAEQPTDSSVAGCYYATVGDAQAFLELRESDEATLRGTLEYAFAQKDSTWGLVRGTLSTSSLALEYEYISEGVVSTRQLTLARTSQGFEGEGFTYTPSDDCGIGPGWSEAKAQDIALSTAQDPENGWLVTVTALVSGPKQGYSYRCITSVTDDADAVVVDWVSLGVTDGSTASSPLTMTSNIRPEDVDRIRDAALRCQVRG